MNNENNLQGLYDKYVQDCQFITGLRAETIRGYRDVFNLFIALVPEVTSVSELSTEMVGLFFNRLQTRERIVGKDKVTKGVKMSTVVTYWSKMNTFLVWLVQKGLLQENPLKGMRPPQPEPIDFREIDDNSIRRLYSAITLRTPNILVLRRDTTMLSLLLFCGLRRGELMSLEGRDIDFDKHLLIVRGTTSKSKRIRHIPIHPTLLLHLRDYIAERNRRKYTTPHLIVSANSDRPLSTYGLKHWVDSLSRKAKVKFHLHQFRHAFATNLAKNDVNAVKIQKLLGHSSLDMTLTYLRAIQPEDLQKDIRKLSF